ncbi:MAG: hypothetical protein J7K40_02180 [candidate division Zixibacteria bacterium]|nr:hypothetical protein [candidate division Zixibacteria bacterium]
MRREKPKPSKKCAYIDYCYIAEAQNCYGYKTDCPLYLVSNDKKVPEIRFHKAMDQLIDKTKAKSLNSYLPKNKPA